jgi:hypothetical protein
MAELFWLNERQWAAIGPLLPHLDGEPRVDDRRIIGGTKRKLSGRETTIAHQATPWSPAKTRAVCIKTRSTAH